MGGTRGKLLPMERRAAARAARAATGEDMQQTIADLSLRNTQLRNRIRLARGKVREARNIAHSFRASAAPGEARRAALAQEIERLEESVRSWRRATYRGTLEQQRLHAIIETTANAERVAALEEVATTAEDIFRAAAAGRPVFWGDLHVALIGAGRDLK